MTDTHSAGSDGQSGDDLGAILAEVRSTKETAEGIAHAGAAPEADVARLLAGLLSHLADQVERIGGLIALLSPEPDPVARVDHAEPSLGEPTASDEDALEEDISPENSLAEPARHPQATGTE
jgi:hypothetical protein